MFGVLIFLITLIFIYLFWNYCQKVFFTESQNNLPGPINLPFIGSYYVFWNSNDFLETVIKLTKNYLSPFQFRLGNKSFIVISEPNDAKVRLFTIIL
ncbi:hypothetical protein PUN28_013957 [Cardiocondyla obscurior]|uniref:Cytochrome P450 n=1 Tax=Cardiocondyla obscurior TaxID=286306 RepID=A0AAW2F740_9HYME